MKYTSKEMQNFDEMQQNINKNSFSDKAKKYIGSILLASQIIGVAPALATTINAHKFNQDVPYQTEMGQIFTEVNIKRMIDNLDVEEVKRRLSKEAPELYPIEELEEWGNVSKGSLSSELLGYVKYNIGLEEENKLEKRISQMSISEMKKTLIENFGYTEDYFEGLDKEEIQEALHGEEKSEILYKFSKKESQRRVDASIKKFEKYLEKSNYSNEIKKIMLSNLRENLKSVEMESLAPGYKGMYVTDSQALEINNFGVNIKSGDIIDENDLRDVWLHEMTHVATMSTVQKDIDDVCDHEKSEYATSSEAEHRCGVQYIGTGGVALNEGMTEYFSNKLLEQNGYKSFVMYPMFISVIKYLVNLYDEDEILYSFVKSPERLEELMEKDGHCFVEFMELLDDAYLEIYEPEKIEEDMSIVDTMKSKAVQKKWKKVGKILDDIKKKRLKENPELVLPESNWKKALEFTEKTEKQYDEYLVEKNSKENSAISKLVSRNKYDSEENNFLSQKTSEFLDRIKINEEDLIVKNESKLVMEKIKKVEKEDDEIIK